MIDERHITSRVLMIRPASFGPNPETRASNAFQREVEMAPERVLAAARQEFDAAVAALRDGGVDVRVLDDAPEPRRPDAVFPNNWLTTHGDGTVVLYPMEAPNRRAEVRPEIVDTLAASGFRVSRVIDLAALSERGQFLEGTGSLVLDRRANIAYAARSSRTHAVALTEFARVTGYRLEVFDTADERGRAIYHTNVLMTLGRDFVALCPDMIPNDIERERLLGRLADSGRRVVALTPGQIRKFAGNMIELETANGKARLALSRRAYDALDDDQLAVLTANAAPLMLNIDTIETVGGGSVRCMIAELFLPHDATAQLD